MKKTKIYTLIFFIVLTFSGCGKEELNNTSTNDSPSHAEEIDELVGTSWNCVIWRASIGENKLYCNLKFEADKKVRVETKLNSHIESTITGSYTRTGNQITFHGLSFSANTIAFTFSSAALFGEKLSVTGTRRGEAMTWNFSM